MLIQTQQICLNYYNHGSKELQVSKASPASKKHFKEAKGKSLGHPRSYRHHQPFQGHELKRQTHEPGGTPPATWCALTAHDAHNCVPLTARNAADCLLSIITLKLERGPQKNSDSSFPSEVLRCHRKHNKLSNVGISHFKSTAW